MKLYAVLTGDLVGSRKLSPRAKSGAQATLKRIAADYDRIHPGAVLGRIDVFRGDSWQFCLEKFHLVLDAAVFLRAALKAESLSLGESLDARIGMAVGEADLVKRSMVSESSGPVFELSGAALDEISGSPSRMQFQRSQNSSLQLPVLSRALVQLLDLQVTRWTSREAVAVHGAMSGLTQEETANLPLAASANGSPPSQQAIGKALARCRWKTHLRPALDRFTAAMMEVEGA